MHLTIKTLGITYNFIAWLLKIIFKLIVIKRQEPQFSTIEHMKQSFNNENQILTFRGSLIVKDESNIVQYVIERYEIQTRGNILFYKIIQSLLLILISLILQNQEYFRFENLFVDQIRISGFEIRISKKRIFIFLIIKIVIHLYKQEEIINTSKILFIYQLIKI
ncbi:unnamed protein product [Paramecium sonneborni]|uniref:Transmembrane protein n=1 Tax=Paramecium sonneborni TaxID=65129 RepID=A0A8S1QKR6_9CILI|nr:unnamed protein product [Paramecium sonneborni]